MTEPDPLRILYREQLTTGVQAIVRGCKIVSADTVRELAEDLVPEKDRKAFSTMLIDTLNHLHEGNVARYRLKLSEFQEWKQCLQNL
jgi:hypothetical protein